MTKFQLHSHVQSILSTTTTNSPRSSWRYACCGFKQNLWTDVRGLPGRRPHSPEVRWACEGVSHPLLKADLSTSTCSFSLCLYFNLTLSLFQPHSEFFLALEPSMGTVRNCNSTRHQVTKHAVICGLNSEHLESESLNLPS